MYHAFTNCFILKAIACKVLIHCFQNNLLSKNILVHGLYWLIIAHKTHCNNRPQLFWLTGVFYTILSCYLITHCYQRQVHKLTLLTLSNALNNARKIKSPMLQMNAANEISLLLIIFKPNKIKLLYP
jgi:hypothetical protein